MFPGILPSFTSPYQSTKLNRKPFAPHIFCFLALFSPWLSYLECPPRSTEVPDLLFLSAEITSVSHFAPAWLSKMWQLGHCWVGQHHPQWAQSAAQLCLPGTATTNTLQAGGRFGRVSVPVFSMESKKKVKLTSPKKVPNCRTGLTVTCSSWCGFLTQAKGASFPQQTGHISSCRTESEPRHPLRYPWCSFPVPYITNFSLPELI